MLIKKHCSTSLVAADNSILSFELAALDAKLVHTLEANLLWTCLFLETLLQMRSRIASFFHWTFTTNNYLLFCFFSKRFILTVALVSCTVEMVAKIQRPKFIPHLHLSKLQLFAVVYQAYIAHIKISAWNFFPNEWNCILG